MPKHVIATSMGLGVDLVLPCAFRNAAVHSYAPTFSNHSFAPGAPRAMLNKGNHAPSNAGRDPM